MGVRVSSYLLRALGIRTRLTSVFFCRSGMIMKISQKNNHRRILCSFTIFEGLSKGRFALRKSEISECNRSAKLRFWVGFIQILQVCWETDSYVVVFKRTASRMVLKQFYGRESHSHVSECTGSCTPKIRNARNSELEKKNWFPSKLISFRFIP